MANQQPIYYATRVDPAGSSVGHPTPRCPYPGRDAAHPSAHQQPSTRTNGDCPPPPPYPGFRAQNVCPPDGARGISRATGDKTLREARPATLRSETRKGEWALFLAGNVFSIAGIVYEIAELEGVCIDWSDDDISAQDFDDDGGDDDDTGLTGYDWVMISLIIGLWVDVFSAVALSAVYRTPLDIKSAHKIPPRDTRNVRMVAIVNFLAPFSWGVVYCCGYAPALEAGLGSPCEGGAGLPGLADFLVVSGSILFYVGVGMLILSGFMGKEACSCTCCACCPCCSSSTPLHVRPAITVAPPQCCCVAWTREAMHEKFLSKSWVFDMAWQLQGTLISYQIGAISLVGGVLVLVSGGLGSALAILGSVGPEEVQELVGPLV